MIKVILSRAEIAFARTEGAKRQHEAENGPGARDSKRGPYKSHEQIHIEGMAGEIAFHKFFGLPLNLTTLGPDFVTPAGTTIDVKSAPEANHRLMTPTDTRQSQRAAVYVLALLHDYEPTVRLVGHTSGATLFNPANTVIVHGSTQAMNQAQLRKLLPNSTLAELDAWLAPPEDHSEWLADYARTEAEWETS